jgi:hypothetical protein
MAKWTHSLKKRCLFCHCSLINVRYILCLTENLHSEVQCWPFNSTGSEHSYLNARTIKVNVKKSLTLLKDEILPYFLDTPRTFFWGKKGQKLGCAAHSCTNTGDFAVFRYMTICLLFSNTQAEATV